MVPFAKHYRIARFALLVKPLLLILAGTLGIAAERRDLVAPVHGSTDELTDGTCVFFAAVFDDEEPGPDCSSSYRPTMNDGSPAPFEVTARSLINPAAPHDPSASGSVSFVHFHTFGLGAKPNNCSGDSGIDGTRDDGDEELIFSFDVPISKSGLELGLKKISFAQDDPVLFVSSAESDQFDFVILETEIQSAFIGTGSQKGFVSFTLLSTIPNDILIDAFKIRETRSRIYVN